MSAPFTNTLPWQECDHCETSERAYADIAPLLKALAWELGKVPEELSIYDPYYCQGSTVGRLAALGFSRVYNQKEDFYEVNERTNAGQAIPYAIRVLHQRSADFLWVC